MDKYEQAKERALASATAAAKKLGVELPGTAGRPTVYSDELADVICTCIASGMSLRSICAQPGMPVLASVMLWRVKNKDFSERYAQARIAGNELLREEMLDIADSMDGDVIETDDGRKIQNNARIARDRLRVEAREKSLKLQYMTQPQRLEVTGADGAPLQPTTIVDVDALREKARKLARERRAESND